MFFGGKCRKFDLYGGEFWDLMISWDHLQKASSCSKVPAEKRIWDSCPFGYESLYFNDLQ